MQRKRNQGFTLIELMVVITILGLLASITSVAVMRHLRTAKIEKAKMDMRGLISGIKTYYLEKRRIPASIQDLCGENEDERYIEYSQPPRDPWDNEYVYEPRDKRNYELRSLGADGVEGGEGEDADITKADLEGTTKDRDE